MAFLDSPQRSQRHGRIYVPTVFHRYNRSLRGVLIDNLPWLVARELGYLIRERVDAYVLRLDKDLFREARLVTGGGEEEVLLVSDYGAFYVLNRFRDPEHRQLRMWITGHLLPTLRYLGRVPVGQPKRLQAKGEGRSLAVLDWQGEYWVPMGEAPRLMRGRGAGEGG